MSAPLEVRIRIPERIEKVFSVVWVVHGSVVCIAIPLTQDLQAVRVVRVPVPKVRDGGVLLFNGPEDLLLIIAILEEAGPGSARIGTVKHYVVFRGDSGVYRIHEDDISVTDRPVLQLA